MPERLKFSLLLWAFRHPGPSSHASRSRASLKAYTCDAPEGELDAGERDEDCERVSEILIVLGEAAITAEPGKGPLDNPTARPDDES
jgi:hypothetical protein